MPQERRFATRSTYRTTALDARPAHLYLFPMVGQVGFCSPAAFEHMAVVQESIEHGREGGAVYELPAPVLDGPVRRRRSAGPFVSPTLRPSRKLIQFLRSDFTRSVMSYLKEVLTRYLFLIIHDQFIGHYPYGRKTNGDSN